MHLDIRTESRWRPVVAFSVCEIEAAKAAGAALVALSNASEMPAEARIRDGQGVVVLRMIAPLGWRVPCNSRRRSLRCLAMVDSHP